VYRCLVWAAPANPACVRFAYHERLAGLATQLAQACGLSGRAMHRATEALLQADLALAEMVIIGDEDITAITRHAHREAFALLALQAPVASELRSVVGSIQIAADVERMGALAVHVAKIVRRRHPDHVVPVEVRPLFADMGRLAVDLSGGAQAVLLSRDPRRAAQIRHDDDAMDEMHQRLLRVMMGRDWSHGVTAAVDLALLGRFYERFADHAVEIGRRVIFQATGEYHVAPAVSKLDNA
jgi:phosphate transport system protein